jgi:hypothetical protein
MVILTKFLEYHPRDFDALFSLIDSVTNEGFRPTQQFFEYIYHHIICNNSIEYWKTIVLRSLEVYGSKSTSQRTKTFLLYNIVHPIIAMDTMRTSKQASPKNPCLMDKAVIQSIDTKIWKVGLGDPNDEQPGVDHTRLEVLQLTAMLIKYHHSILRETRQDIIKFVLNHTRLDDVFSKHAAHVVISYYIIYFETPTEIIRQVYTSLLESSYDEGRALVTQALELIASVLPKLRSAVPDDRNPIWVAAAPGRILIEGRQNVQKIMTVFNFLPKHPELFYEYRERFIIPIVQSLRMIAQPLNSSDQGKKLVLQLMKLVWQWEQHRVEGKKFLSTESKFEDSGEPLTALSVLSMISSTSADKSEYETPTRVRTKMIGYLVEFVVSLKPQHPRLSAAMSLFYNLLQPRYWGGLFNARQVVRILPCITTLAGGRARMVSARQVVRILRCEANASATEGGRQVITTLGNLLSAQIGSNEAATGRVKYRTLKELEAEWASSRHSAIGAELVKRYYVLGRTADPAWASFIRNIIQHITCIDDSGLFSDDEVLIRLALLQVLSASISIDAKMENMVTQKKRILFERNPLLETDFELFLGWDVPTLLDMMDYECCLCDETKINGN